MDRRISEDERADFRSCRRRWDFSSPGRRNVETVRLSRVPDLERGVKDALAVYYFPGMWDWPRSVVLPLVAKGLERSLAGQRARVEADEPLTPAEQLAWQDARSLATTVLHAYTTWAPASDRFAPVLVDPEFTAQVPDPHRPGSALATAEGGGPGCNRRPRRRLSGEVAERAGGGKDRLGHVERREGSGPAAV
jgi:hypothetical protein